MVSVQISLTPVQISQIPAKFCAKFTNLNIILGKIYHILVQFFLKINLFAQFKFYLTSHKYSKISAQPTHVYGSYMLIVWYIVPMYLNPIMWPCILQQTQAKTNYKQLLSKDNSLTFTWQALM